jgi:hypothetical protein
LKRYPYTQKRALPAWSLSAQKRRKLPPYVVSTLLRSTERCGISDEESELIEMRYQQALALLNLEDLFAEGQLDSANREPNATVLSVQSVRYHAIVPSARAEYWS